MISFVAMPLVIGLMNFAVPLQLGVRDVTFPVFDSVNLRLTATGGLLINLSLVIGNFARTGWNWYQFRSDDSKIAGPGHDVFPHAGILLDRPDRKFVDRRRLPNPYCDLHDAGPRCPCQHAGR
jgi:heme/copper-type cytochrome/quinol oxidase subunit 1